MNDSDQMTLGFETASGPLGSGSADSPTAHGAQTKKRTRRGLAQTEGFALSLEDMAKAIDAHDDYRVLRRLVPRHDWGPLPDGTTRRVIVLDTETTGLDVRQERIIELAMLSVLVDDATGMPVGPVTVYEAFEDPGKPISPNITEITGITDSMVVGQRLDDERIIEMVNAADLVLAHNAGFDRPFVESRLPVFASKAWNCSFAGIDWKGQGRGSAKLEFLAQTLGWFYDAHRALVDCHALLQVLATPLNDGQTGLAHLLAGASQSRFKLRATGAPFESKDMLKSRGYRWDNEARVWWTSLPHRAGLDEELDWLKQQIYGTKSAQLHIEEQNSQVMFSHRTGATRLVSL